MAAHNPLVTPQPPPLTTTKSAFHCLDVCFSESDVIKYAKEAVVRARLLWHNPL